jgi:hypothetical protein
MAVQVNEFHRGFVANSATVERLIVAKITLLIEVSYSRTPRNSNHHQVSVVCCCCFGLTIFENSNACRKQIDLRVNRGFQDLPGGLRVTRARSSYESSGVRKIAKNFSANDSNWSRP